MSMRESLAQHRPWQERRLPLPTHEEFRHISAHIKKLAGINLPPSDKNLMLISGRFQKIMREGLCSSYSELIKALDGKNPVVLTAFISALTTNTTSFFRENDHFDFLRRVLPNLAEYKTRSGVREPLHFWCSPCSTGEEAYTMAMVAQDALAAPQHPVKILATDISDKVLRIARAGEYNAMRMREVPPSLSVRFFEPCGNKSERRVRVTDSLRSMITFGRFNLLLDYPFSQAFDVIFCRNVLIYFERKDAEYVVGKLRDNLRKGGFLFLGHSETSVGSMPGLRRIGPAIYVRE